MYSEIPQVGRLPVYMFTLVIFVLFLIPTALASNFGMLLAFRFLTGFFGSPALATGGATISDMFHPKHRAYAITLWGLFAVSHFPTWVISHGNSSLFRLWGPYSVHSLGASPQTPRDGHGQSGS